MEIKYKGHLISIEETDNGFVAQSGKIKVTGNTKEDVIRIAQYHIDFLVQYGFAMKEY